MPHPKHSDEVVAETIRKFGIAQSARILGMSTRAMHSRRRNIEARWGEPIVTPLQKQETGGKGRLQAKLKDGIAIVGSDPHYWPGIISTAHAGLIKFCEDLKPAIVIMDGDVVDGASIGRWPAIGWEYRPEFADELEAVQLRLAEIEAAAPKAKKYWPLGNHDARFESLIANKLPELARVQGVHLKDHFDKCWNPCWSVWINGDTVVKHRFRNGVHAARNNVMYAGKHMVTGHLHQGKYEPFPDYNGVRFGVSLPWMGENYGPQTVDYTEDNPVQWRSGFAVLTFIDGVLCEPEFAIVRDTGVIEFRGQRIKV